jgi:VWFA-related protein
MVRRSFTIVCSIAASAAILAAQGTGVPPPLPPQDPQTPVFRARVDSVSVDVSVTDRDGRPITDLTVDDFEIREAGKPQTIETFRLIEVDDDAEYTPRHTSQILSFADMQRATADPENRLLLIFLDDYHTRKGNALQIRKSLARFVGELTQRDLVAVLYPLTSIAATTFSRDHDGTAAAMMSFQGRKYTYGPTTPYEQNFAHFPPEIQEQIRNELTIRSLRSACALMSSLREGRKSLLFVSEGMAATLPAGVNTGTPVRNPTFAPPSQMQLSKEFFDAADLLGRMRDIFSTCSRGNVSIYPLDPRGLSPTEFDAGDRVDMETDRRTITEAFDSLRTLADQTDGRAIIGRNDPIPDLKQMVQELGVYYLLGYTSSVAPRDGRFHEIDVRVKRPGVQIRARKGYWAYTEDEIRRASAPPKPGPPIEVGEALDNLAAIVEPNSRRHVALWMGAVRGETEKPNVTLVWETTPGAPTDPAEGVEQVTVTATSGDEVVYRGAITRDPGAVRPSGRVSFEAPAGPLRLRVVSENARGVRIDSEDVHEMVPDFTAPGANITSPAVFRARTAYEIRQLRTNAAALPSASRQFSRTETLLLRFDAYGPAGTTPDVSMRLLNRQGDPLTTLPAPARSADAHGSFEAEIPLAALPPGDYIIEIAAVTATDKSARLLGIRVTG